MNATTVEIINRFRTFFELPELNARLIEASRKGKCLQLEFSEISKFDSELGEALLETPEDILKAAEICMDGMDLPGEEIPPMRLTELPESIKSLVTDLRVKRLNTLVSVEGIVKGMTQVVGHVGSSRFECPSCGNIINIIQFDKKFKEPTRCGCGRKGKFHLLSKELVDAFTMKLEEAPDLLNNSNPNLESIAVLFKKDLTNSKIYGRLRQGIRVDVVGTVIEQQLMDRQGGLKNEVIWYIDANNIHIFDDDYSTLEISEEDKKEIIEFSKKSDVLECLSQQIFSDIEGAHMEKQLLTLQIIGGTKFEKARGRERGDIIGLLCGDSSLAKTKFGKDQIGVVPKGRYVSGGGSSKVGLGAGVEKDELLGKNYLVAGALPLSHKGHCVIDELDGLTADDSKMLNEALENQEIHIDKIVKGTFKCECSVLMCANPKSGKFDEYASIAQQINIRPALLSRCDFILLFRDEPNEDKDRAIMATMMRGSQELDEERSTEFLRKYVMYAKMVEPVMTQEANEYIVDTFVEIRKKMTNSETKNIPITFRDGYSIRRLSQAVARTKLKNRIELEDVQKAMKLKMYSLYQTAFDKQTGTLDTTGLYTGKSITERSLWEMITNYLRDDMSDKPNEIENVYAELNQRMQGKIPIQIFDSVIDKMKKGGDVYFPRQGQIKLI